MSDEPSTDRLVQRSPDSAEDTGGDCCECIESLASFPRQYMDRSAGSASMLRVLIRHMQDAVVLVDRNYRVLEINDRALSLLGLPPDAHDLILTPDLDPGMVRDSSGRRVFFEDSAYYRCLQGETVENLEIVHTLKDGRECHLILNGSPIFGDDGEVEMALIVARDITEFKTLQIRTQQMLDQITRQQASLMCVINNMPVGVLFLDSKLKLLAANKVYSQYFGDKPVWRVGAHITEILPLAEESGIVRLLQQTLQTRRAVKVRDFAYSGFGRGITYWRASAAPMCMQTEDGELEGVIVVTVDVTEEIRARERLQELYRREQYIANKLQMSCLPDECPYITAFDIAHQYRAALDEARVGGDFYDVFPLGDGRCGVAIGDVAGKGLKAAVYTGMTKYMLRAYALEDSAPDRVLRRLNEALSCCTPSEVFVTVIYGVLDSSNLTFTYAAAGHEPPMYYCAADGTGELLHVSGGALALLPDSTYTASTLHMYPGDLLMLYTDGVTDAGWGADSNRVGHARILERLCASADKTVDEIGQSMIEYVLNYAGGKLSDDAAFLIIRALPAESVTQSR